MMSNKRFLTGLALAGLLTVSASAAFSKTNTYANGQFTDVSEWQWYASEVKNTYELGLMNGIGGGLFDPEGNVTVAEAVTMASRAASINSGEAIAQADGEWYQMYVNYALSKGFVKDGQFDSFDRPAKRYEVASLFENAMSDDYFNAKNAVDKIPDVSEAQSYHDDLLTLYKAGVVMGSDAYGNFMPEDNITRAEAAAIINRVALPENRLSKTLNVYSEDDAYVLNYTPDLGVDGGRTGTPSGWTIDNRGGQPATDYKINLSAIKDKSDDEEVRLIREWNKVSTGTIQLETQVTLNVAEGFYIELNNESGKEIYRIEVKDGKWHYLGADGNLSVLNDGEAKGTHQFIIEIDLDNGWSNTYIRAEDFAIKHSEALTVSGEQANTVNMIYGSTEEGKAEFTMDSSYAYVNYSLYDDFKFKNYNWFYNNAGIKDDELVIRSGGKYSKYSRYFKVTSGTVIAEAMMYLNKDTKAAMTLFSGTKTVAKLETDGKNILINGKPVYEYYDGLWYDVRFELDTDNMELTFKLNGIERAKVPFAEKSTSVDCIAFSAAEESAEVKIDNVKVYRTMKHDDYVPEPVKPKGEEKYNVGVNICSLWVEGKHFGWETISRFDEPILGYYTEGIPETADWEIKYMVEHGIDFQAFCWYSFENGTPVKEHDLHDHLDHGYKNAEYSHMMSYALLLELANKRIDLESWEKYTVPYITEHYFKDPRYMRIDNKAVVCSFNLGSLTKSAAMGSTENVKKALDMLEQAAVECGFDGMIFMSCASGMTKAEEAAVGVDATYNYHFGTDGSRFDTNTTANLYQAKDTATHTVPTVSVGFQSVGWMDVRFPLMNVEDYARLNKWVTDEFLPMFASEEESWKRNTVMLSTWNEFGEGTYINPTRNNGGFGYLDGIRAAYTDEKADESVNTVPTAEQLRRINRMYPSYKQMLMHDGYVSKTAEKEIIFTVDGTTDKAIKTAQMESVKQDENGIGGTATGNDPRFVLEMFGNKVNTSKVSAIRVTLKVPKGSTVELYFKTSEDNNYNQNKWMTAEATEDGFSTVTFDVSNHVSWSGLLTGLYVDPMRSDGEGNECILKSVEILGKNDLGLARRMTINGLKFDTNFAPIEASNGDILVPFDLTLGLEYKLDSFVEWNKDTQTIIINGEDHYVSFTVGSKAYVVDDKTKTLDYEIPETDGLPTIPFKIMAEALGYEYSYTDADGVSVDVPEFKGLYNSVSDSAWEFDVMGFLGGWNSSNSTLEIHPDGYLAMSNGDGTDPMMFTSFVKPLPAKKYKELHIRIKFDYSEPLSWTQLFWATNKSGSWSEDKSVKIFINELSSKGEWKEYKLDLTQISGWSDNITKLRFDPFNSKGTMEIDYIRLIEDPDYIPEEAAVEEEITGPITLVNGDMEGEGGFTSPERYEIIEDPDGSENHILKVTPKDDGKKWLYTWQKVRFTPGTTYKVTLDHKIASHGINEELEGDVKGILICNIQYSDTKGSDKNHLVKQFYVTKEWTHTEFTFTVDEQSDIRSDDLFSFYTNPLEEKGVGYYLDNITITEVE